MPLNNWSNQLIEYYLFVIQFNVKLSTWEACWGCYITLKLYVFSNKDFLLINTLECTLKVHKGRHEHHRSSRNPAIFCLFMSQFANHFRKEQHVGDIDNIISLPLHRRGALAFNPIGVKGNAANLQLTNHMIFWHIAQLGKSQVLVEQEKEEEVSIRMKWDELLRFSE